MKKCDSICFRIFGFVDRFRRIERTIPKRIPYKKSNLRFYNSILVRVKNSLIDVFHDDFR